MENLSILNLFSAKANVGLPKMNDVSGGQFEDVFKSYLDRSADDGRALKTDTAANDSNSVQAEEPETPEDVIDSLNIPDEQKAELKKKLEDAETAEDAEEFVEELVAAAGENAEEILTQMALTLLNAGDSSVEISGYIMEETLNQLAAVQSQNNQPHLTLVENNVESETSGNEGESKSEMLQAALESADDQQLPAELKEKIAQFVAGQQVSEKVTTENSDASGFTVKTEFSEKVLTTEVKIESPRDIMKFAELMELAKNQKVNKLNIQLHPQELGRVSIELTEQAGKVSGKVVFESETARHLFTSNAEGLRQQLADKGVIVENLEFVFKDFEQHEFAGWEGREGKNNSKNSSFVGLTSEEDEAEEADGIYA